VGILELLGVSVGEVVPDFLEDLESHHPKAEADVKDPHNEDAFVLLDLRDAVSEDGEDWPEDDSEYIEGLSQRTLDSVIQWCSGSILTLALQSSLDVS
jgi:hypothetical protein